ncbi:zinc-finger homeodomain protein 11-like [Salvia miltiorrhiza]|uniref:zinc-finger homeodomain protein 11-like n=1 Tax=Salvia miltiorrhiza TaxID=226208 RepID=UPI0025AD28F3|nr:zinc-finger homeodomain protein 11-like [Salvia miltiorrhiza]
MDIDLTPTPTPTSAKSPDDNEIDTPPHTSNGGGGGGALKHHHHHLPRRRHPPIAAAYKECMKNHAAAIGGHAVDGCGEFMPPPPQPSPDPAALTCAACGCHRNFHRRDPESPTSAAAITPPFLDFRHPAAPLPKRFSLSLSPSPPPPPPAAAAAPSHVFFAGAEDHHPAPVTPTVENPVGRKRFRTKFSQDQKEKMRSFSVKLGWKMQKCDEAAVKEFCHEIGVSKGVLKVWMHNNKHTFKTESGGGIANGSVISFEHSGGSGSGGGGVEERKSDRNGNIFVENGNGSVHRFYGSSSSPA